jgi:hypothetical protein
MGQCFCLTFFLGDTPFCFFERSAMWKTVKIDMGYVGLPRQLMGECQVGLFLVARGKGKKQCHSNL